MGLNVSPPIRQSYRNAIHDCLESRKYYEAIMDDLLLFTPQSNLAQQNWKTYKSITEEWSENICKEVPIF